MCRASPIILLSLLLAAACATAPTPPPPLTFTEVTERAVPLGRQMRTAQICGADISLSAQDRAARIEATAIALQQRVGGTAARDAFLKGLEQPRQRSRERAAWCRERVEAIARSAVWLDTPEAESFAQKAEALLN